MWDPVFLEIPGVPVDLRYYGLMYVVGFIVGNMILARLARSGFLPLPQEKVGDLLFALILGVILGGRIGYSLFYKPEVLANPIELLKVWEGGLSFHGGLIGVIVAYTLFARKHKLPVWRVGDCLALATCPGIFAVRMANFINGELYGRIIPEEKSDSVPWAMRFWTDPIAQTGLGIHGGMAKREQETRMLEAYQNGEWAKILKEGVLIRDPVTGVVEQEMVPLRHPSQIYEALAEGLFLGFALWVIYRKTKGKPLGTGSFMGIFLIGYGGMRFILEYFRQPDDIPGLIILGLSRGQQLCTLMVAIGVTLLILRRKKFLPPPGDTLETAATAATEAAKA